MPWQPYLHVTVWWGVALTVIMGDSMFFPAEDVFDWIWLIGGLCGPLLGLFSVWLLKNSDRGEVKYRALWLRLSADIFILSTVASFEAERIAANTFQPFLLAIMAGVLTFLTVLIVLDTKFLIMTERIAVAMSKGNPQ